jgi:hypothetical protein
MQVSKQPEDGVQPGSVPPVDAEIEPFLGDSGFEAQGLNSLGKGVPDLIPRRWLRHNL